MATTNKTKKSVKKVSETGPKTKTVSLDAVVYDQKGVAGETIKLPENVFGVKWNGDMVHQVVTSILGNKRAGTADTKDRGEVRGGGIKPWKQKGTGRSRHGSSRSPIWVGGGTTHGPITDKNYKRKINKKMRNKALATVLSEKWKSGQVLFVSNLKIGSKTKEGASVINALKSISGFEKIGVNKRKNTALIFPQVDEVSLRPFGNIPAVRLESVLDINPAQILNYKYIIIVDPEVSLSALTKRVNSK